MEPKRLIQHWPLFGLIFLFCLTACGPEEVPVVEVPLEEDPRVVRARAWADARLAEMSLAEKVGQLVMVRPSEGRPPSTQSLNYLTGRVSGRRETWSAGKDPDGLRTPGRTEPA